MTDRQASVLFTIDGLPYKVEPLILLPGESTIRIDQALERFPTTAHTHINKEDVDSICRNPGLLPAELRGLMLLTHCPTPNGGGYSLFIRVRTNRTVMQDSHEPNRTCSPRYVRVLLRG